jgi:hypothetical protein
LMFVNNVLYLSTGDGGSGCDPANNAQSSTTITGKILRIQLGYPSASDFNYTSVAPTAVAGEFCGKNLSRQQQGLTLPCQEVFVKGMRNPYRCSVYQTDIYCGDVGQGTREEVDVISTTATTIANYGWDIFEGVGGAIGQGCTGSSLRCPLNTNKTVNKVTYTCPIAQELHRQHWHALIGGFVCNHCGPQELHRKYLYADYLLPQSLRALDLDNKYAKSSLVVSVCANATNCVVQSPSVPLSWMLFSFGQDASSRIFLIHAFNGLYRITQSSYCH